MVSGTELFFMLLSWSLVCTHVLFPQPDLSFNAENQELVKQDGRHDWAALHLHAILAA
jgi:hypothetical protein